jgi:hypothetical protein
MAMREYNTYDLYGLLQGLLDALSRHTNAIPLQTRVELAMSIIEALPDDPADVHIEVAPRVTRYERSKQLTAQREQTTPTIPPKLSPLGELIAY